MLRVPLERLEQLDTLEQLVLLEQVQLEPLEQKAQPVTLVQLV